MHYKIPELIMNTWAVANSLSPQIFYDKLSSKNKNLFTQNAQKVLEKWNAVDVLQQ